MPPQGRSLLRMPGGEGRVSSCDGVVRVSRVRRSVELGVAPDRGVMGNSISFFSHQYRMRFQQWP